MKITRLERGSLEIERLPNGDLRIRVIRKGTPAPMWEGAVLQTILIESGDALDLLEALEMLVPREPTGVELPAAERAQTLELSVRRLGDHPGCGPGHIVVLTGQDAEMWRAFTGQDAEAWRAFKAAMFKGSPT